MFLPEVAKKITENIIKMLVKKNKQYGDSFNTTIEEWGEPLFVARLQDKLERLKQTVKMAFRGEKVSIEKYESDLTDLVGYCILRLTKGIKKLDLYRFSEKQTRMPQYFDKLIKEEKTNEE